VPGQHATEEQKRKLFYLVFDPEGPRLGKARAAAEVGISRATAYRILGGHDRAPKADREAAQRDLPAPKRLEELSTDARDALEDFNLFGEMFFALRPSPWRRDAAMRIVDAIADHENRTFIDLNVFPGAGKTTLGKVLVTWLISGGGIVNPAAGRGLRGMLGSETQKVARHMLRNIRLPLELRRPFSMFDKSRGTWTEATHTLAIEYGRYKPDQQAGEESLWSQDQILVASLADIDLVLKEPTLQVASQESGFLGERVDFAFWDDLSTTKNSRNPVTAEALNVWCENEAETRVEKGGVFLHIGQRLGPSDLHRKRLDARVESETGELVPLYQHIIYPSHHDALCDGDHRQWDPETDSGCLTDADAMSVKDWRGVQSKQNYRTVYQQEDVDPARVLVQQAWLEGVVDSDGYPSPGCYDRDRGFYEWPKGVGELIDYAVVDPAAGNWWVREWWALQPETEHAYLIHGKRGKIQAGAFLDWDNREQQFVGWMHETQMRSIELGHPIRIWIIEAKAAHKYLFQFEHYRRWRVAFPDVTVIAHQTNVNKNDPELGVEAILPTRYKTGMKHLPKKPGVDVLNYLRVKEKELTTYPFAEADDTVLADWFGDWNIPAIKMAGRRALRGEEYDVTAGAARHPAYLRNQRETIHYAQEG
jgi:hypothetical protein